MLQFFDQSELDPGSVDGPENDLRIGIQGNPSFGNVRVIMLGMKNATTNDISGEVWFNELRLSELKNQGGWGPLWQVWTPIWPILQILVPPLDEATTWIWFN